MISFLMNLMVFLGFEGRMSEFLQALPAMLAVPMTSILIMGRIRQVARHILGGHERVFGNKTEVFINVVACCSLTGALSMILTVTDSDRCWDTFDSFCHDRPKAFWIAEHPLQHWLEMTGLFLWPLVFFAAFAGSWKLAMRMLGKKSPPIFQA